MTRLKIYFILLLMVFMSDVVIAQPFVGLKEIPKQSISFELSISPAFLGGFTYYYRMDSFFKNKDVVLHATLVSPIFLIKEVDSFRFGSGASVKYGEWGNFAVVAGTAIYFATNKNVNGNFVAWGLEFDFQPGYFKEKWFISLNLSWKQTLMTHIKHSQYARSAFEDRYPEGISLESTINGPRDGWYRTPAQHWKTGLIAGYRISKSVTLYGGGGIDYTPNEQGFFMFADVGVIPFYGQIGVVYHLVEE